MNPYKHTTWIPRWNDVETVVSSLFQCGIHVASTSFQRGIYVVRL